MPVAPIARAISALRVTSARIASVGAAVVTPVSRSACCEHRLGRPAEREHAGVELAPAALLGGGQAEATAALSLFGPSTGYSRQTTFSRGSSRSSRSTSPLIWWQ